MTPLQGFSPGLEASTPGAIMDCRNFIPYLNGMEGGPTATTPSDVPALAAECLGIAILTKLDGTRRIIAGTATKLYELIAGAWTDISRVGAYSATQDSRWMFAQFGNTTLAATIADTIQRSPSSGAFANIATAPKAEIIFPVGSQVMALNTNDGTVKQDGWHVCAINDETSWTPSLATQAASGRLVSTPGAITAGARLGNYAVAYKAKSIYIGQYVGTPSIWDWQEIPGGEIGCVGKEAICDIGPAHFFVSDNGFYLFDGSKAIPVGEELRQWFLDNSSPTYRYRTKCVYDRQTSRVWVFYVSATASTCNSALVFHVKTKFWGRADRTIEAVLNYISPGITIDAMGSISSTIDGLPDIAMDSQYWLSGGRALSVINTSHQLQLLTGASDSSSFTTNDIGDDIEATLLNEIRLRFPGEYAPATAAVTIYCKRNSGDSWAVGGGAPMSDGKFDVMQEARWHRAVFDFTGPVRVVAGDPKLLSAGDR